MPQALDDYAVTYYTMILEKDDGTREEFRYTSHYYVEPMKENVGYAVSTLESGTHYKVTIYATNAFDKTSEPIRGEFSTLADE